MKKITNLIAFETKRMLLSKSTFIYAVIYLVNYIISVVFFKLYGNEGSVLTVGNAQSFPIQHLQASYFFTGVFIAIYVAQIIVQDRSLGTIKLVLSTGSRLEYFISRIISIFLFTIVITLMMIILSYITALISFGWGDQLLFNSIVSSGIQGIGITLLCSIAFMFSYFAFSLIAMVVGMFIDRLMEGVMIMGILLMVGQYVVLMPSIKQLTIFYQMLFFHIDIFEKSFSYNVISFFVLLMYCIVFGGFGYFIFRRKDLKV